MKTSIDHVVTLTADLQAASTAAQNLGFFCTPESQLLSASSANRTIVFEHDYWELLTVLEATPINAAMRGSANLRSGINGICASSCDLDQSIAAAQSGELALSGPISLTRKILLNGQERELRFRVAHCLQFPDALLLFYCEHKTRELVLRKEWQSHPNGALGLGKISLVTEHVTQTASAIAWLFDGTMAETAKDGIRIDAGRQTICVVPPCHFEPVEALIGSHSSGVAVLGVRCRSPDAALKYAAERGTQVLQTPAGRCFAYAPGLGDLIVEFIS